MSARNEIRLFAMIFAVAAVMWAVLWAVSLREMRRGLPNAAPDSSISRAMVIQPDSHTLGPPNAPFTLVEFLDLQCPNCAQSRHMTEGFLASHPGQLRIVYHHYQAVPQHALVPLLARATEAAGEQGRFWEMCRAIFDDQPAFAKRSPAQAEKAVTGIARRLKLDVPQFTAALHGPETKRRYDRDIEVARRSNLGGMPGFFFFGPQGPPIRLHHLMQMRDWLNDPAHWR